MNRREQVVAAMRNAKILDLKALREALKAMGEMSPDELVACLLQLPPNKRAIVIIDDKVQDGKGRSPHAGRRSCVICRGALTERNQLAVPMKFTMKTTDRVMYCYVLVCSGFCEERLKERDWLEQVA